MDEQIKLPKTTADDNSGGTISWVDTDNVKSDDSSYSTATLGNDDTSHLLNATNFGFNIPFGSVINGIEVSIQRKCNGTGGNGVYLNNLNLRKSSGLVGVNMADEDGSFETIWTTSDFTSIHGDSSELWGTTWSASEINSPNFGLSLQVWSETSGADNIAYIDYVSIAVYYTTVDGTFIVINGANKTNLIQWDTLTREENLSKEPSKLTFSLNKSSSGAYKPVVGDEVVMEVDGVREFGGFLVEARERVDGLQENIKCLCKDYTEELDRLLVSKIYTNMTVAEIIADLVDTFSSGFTYANVNCDINIDKVAFNYLPISKCLEKLTDLVADYAWYCGYDKDINFFLAQADNPSLFFTDTSGSYTFGSLATHEDTHQLRNEIIVRGGLLISETAREELLSGDGTKVIFPLATKFASLPTVEVGGVPKTVGVANLDTTGYDVYWDYNEKSLEFTTAPASGANNISVEQVYEYPLILQKRNEFSISEYGVFQFVIVDKTIKSLETAGLRADAELIKYSMPAKTANFKTRTQDITAGDIINIQSDVRNTDDNYKVSMIRSRFIDPINNTFEHSIEAITSEDIGINAILAKLLIQNPSDQIQIAQGEVVSRIRQFRDTFDITDSIPTASKLLTTSYKWTSGEPTLVWGFGKWA